MTFSKVASDEGLVATIPSTVVDHSWIVIELVACQMLLSGESLVTSFEITVEDACGAAFATFLCGLVFLNGTGSGLLLAVSVPELILLTVVILGIGTTSAATAAAGCR